MKKRPFLIFISIVGLLIAGAVSFIQSTYFATTVKRFTVTRIPKELGIDADFSDFSIKLFPPAISINRPRVVVKKRNVLDMPEGASVSAQRIDLSFQLFQMFSGSIRIHKVTVVGGDVQLSFGKNQKQKSQAKQKSGFGFKWNDLLRVRAESLELQDTRVRMWMADPAISMDLMAKYLFLAQWSEKGDSGYELGVELEQVRGAFPKSWSLPPEIDQVSARITVSSLGINVNELKISSKGSEIYATGRVNGNIVNPQSLLAEAEIKASADLMRISEWLDGRALFNGKLRGDLLKPLESLKAEGSLVVSKARFKNWGADEVQVTGAWAAGPSGGEISITKASISAQEMERSGAHQPGRGGKIDLGAFKLKLGATDPVIIPVTLERAHIHWLAASVLKDVYPLNFRINGPLQLTYSPAAKKEHSWGLQAKVDFTINDFRLDNQKLGKIKPLKSILRVPKLGLKGGIRIDAAGISPDGLELIFPSSKALVTGKIDFKEGYDLYAGGQLKLEEIGPLAEKDLRGEGKLTAHIYGPSSRVLIDFDADVKNAYYLNLHFGDLKGRLTYDEDPSHLFLKNVEVTKGRMIYKGDGMLDLGDAESIALDIRIFKGDVHELIDVFQELTKDLWWFPRTLIGDMTGSIRLSGGLSLDRLEVASDIVGTNWEFLGETFRIIGFRGGYDKGKYFIDSMSAIKQTGKVTGHISFDQQARFDWGFKTDGFTLSDIDHVARLDVPIRGKLEIQSNGKGKAGTIESATQTVLTRTSVRGISMPQSELMLKSSSGIISVKGSALGGQGILEASYDFSPGGQSAVRADLRRLDFSPLLLLLNPRAIQDPELTGRISGLVDMTFRSGEIEMGSGRLELSEYILAKSGTKFELLAPVLVKMDRGTFLISDLTIRGRQSDIHLGLRGKGAEIEGNVTGDLDLSIVEFFTPSIARAVGTAGLNIDIGGTLKSPAVFGSADINGGVVGIHSLESPFENITGSIHLKQNLLTVQDLEGELANGHVKAGGTIKLFADRYPQINLTSHLSGNKLKVFPFQYVKVSGKLSVSGEDIPYLVDGSVKIESALTTEKVLNPTQSIGLKSAKYTPPPTLRKESDYPKFKLNIGFEGSNGILVKNDLFDAELSAKGTVVNTIETPRILGRVELVQGRMMFKDRTFQLQSAAGEFDNPTVINPRFNLSANTEISGNRIQLYTSGRLDHYKIELSSNPVLPESEILSLLALGFTSEDVRRLRSADRTVLEQGEVASLVLHSTDFNRDLQDKTGLQIQIDEAVNNQVGTSVFKSKSDTDVNASAPKIVIKRRIGKKLDVSVGSTVGVGANTQSEVNAEVHVSPGFSVIGVWDTQEETGSGKRESYGVDLKLQKRFK